MSKVDIDATNSSKYGSVDLKPTRPKPGQPMTGTVILEMLIWTAATGVFALVTGWRIVSQGWGKRDATIDNLEQDAETYGWAFNSRA